MQKADKKQIGKLRKYRQNTTKYDFLRKKTGQNFIFCKNYVL